ncbi:MAG: sterol desaturase family protein [Pseudomonadota bacterium]
MDVSTAKIVVFGLFVSVGLLEALRSGFLSKDGQKPGDLAADGTAYVVLSFLVVPGVFVFVNAMLGIFAPEASGAWAHWPFAVQLLMLAIFDDMMQYWWHRASHTFPWLYGLHRGHHEAGYMSVRIVYRNNMFYYALMPSIWFSAALVYMGFGWSYALFLIVKQTVIFGAHSDLKWDRFLYRNAWLSPVAWVVERVISTPSTHFMHHGKHLADGITHYKGNFGNLFFFWDVLFGTAKITRQYPEEFGTENLAPVSWQRQIFSPRGAGVEPETPASLQPAE